MRAKQCMFSLLLSTVFCAPAFCGESNVVDTLLRLTSNSQLLATKPNGINAYMKSLSPLTLRDSTDQTMIFVAAKPAPKSFKEIRIEFAETSGGEIKKWAFNFFTVEIENSDSKVLADIIRKYKTLLRKPWRKNILGDDTNYSWDLNSNFGLVVSANAKLPNEIKILISKKESED